jgi:hypothetical protein
MRDKKRLIEMMTYSSYELDDIAALIKVIFGKESYQCRDAKKLAAAMRFKKNVFKKEFENER